MIMTIEEVTKNENVDFTEVCCHRITFDE